jgi:hypothetical protein
MIKIEDNIEESKKDPKKFKGIFGIQFEELDFTDINIKITGQWDEMFCFSIPDVFYDIIKGHKHEMIFKQDKDSELPEICIAVQIASSIEQNYFFSFLLSTKERNPRTKKETWFQYLRGEVKNDLSVKITIRDRDYFELYSDPYEALEKIKHLNFKDKIKQTMRSLASYYKSDVNE